MREILSSKKNEAVLRQTKKHAKSENASQSTVTSRPPQAVRKGGAWSMADKNFGRIIEDRRHQLNLTQEMIAKRVGVKANYIGYLERGMRHPSQKPEHNHVKTPQFTNHL